MALGQLLVELGINSASFHAGIDKATYATKQFGNDLKQSFSQLRGSFSQLGAQLGASFGPLSGILSSVAQGFSAVGSAVKAAGSGVPAFMQIIGAAGGIGAAAVGAAVGMAALSNAGSKTAEELIRNAEKLGVTTEQMGALKLAAEYTDVPLQALTRGFAHFAKGLGDIGEKVTPASSILKQMGVTAGTGTYEGLEKATSAIQRMEDPVQKMNAATTLFGTRLGLQLLPMLSDASVSFAQFAQMARSAGLSIDAEGKKKTEDWKLATTELSGAWDGLKLSFANQEWVVNEMRGITMLVEGFRKLISVKEGAQQDLGGGSTGFEAATSDNGSAEAQRADATAAQTTAKASSDKATSEKKAADAARESSRYFEEQYHILKEGGVAADNLRQKQDEIKGLVEGMNGLSKLQQAAAWQLVAAKQAEIEGLQILADEEKKLFEERKHQAETLRDIEKRNKSDFTQTKDVYGNEVYIRRDLLLRQELAKVKEKDAEEEKRQLDDVAATFKKDAEEEARMNERVALSYESITAARNKSATQQKRTAITADAEAGVISKRQEQQMLLALDQEELKEYQKTQADKLAILKNALTQAQATQQSSPGFNSLTGKSNDVEADKAAAQAQIAYNVALGQGIEKEGAMTDAIIKEEAALRRNPFSDFIKGTQDVKDAIQANIVRGLDGVATGLAKTIVEGKNFGKEMRAVAQQVLEGFIEMELKRMMAHIMADLGITSSTITNTAAQKTIERAADSESIISSAHKAAAKAWSNAPNPIIGAIEAAATFVGVLAFDSFDQGGIVGHTGMAKVHENEMVLPRPLSEKVQRMTDDSSSGARGAVHVTYSPTVHAVDGKGIGDMLNKHGQQFTQYFTQEMRRRNMI